MNPKPLLCLLGAFLLSGCSALAKPTPAPLPTVVLGSSSGTTPGSSVGSSAQVIASGIVVPAAEAQLAFALGGVVEALLVAVGDQVEAGQVLARLAGGEQLQAALSAAELEVLSAQQDLKRLQENADQEAAQAQLNLATARDALKEAQDQWQLNQPGHRATPEELKAAKAKVVLAQKRLENKQRAYDHAHGRTEKAYSQIALTDALDAYQTAVWYLDWLQEGATEIEQGILDAELQQAQSALDEAQQEWERVKDGPDPDQLALAQARLKNAQDQVAGARADLANLELKAPFAGTASRVSIQVGDWVAPGQVIIQLADLDHMRVKTTDLSELDVPKIAIGQAATVFIEALNQEVNGHVTEISPQADTLGGDVVYETTLELETQPAGLRAGMSVEVHFGGGQ